jgi:prolipoprotein diacylglyceryltransferase
MLPVLQIGPLALPLPELLILGGIWIGLSLAERYAKRYEITPDQLFYLTLTGLLSGVIGARLAYVLRYPQAFTSNPLDIFSRNLGLFDPSTGLLLGVLGALIYVQRKKLSWLAVLDAITPALAVLAVAVGLSHLASGEAYGAPADLAWGVNLWGALRHPSQVYETLAALMILGLLWPGHEGVINLRPGGYFLRFIACSAMARLLLEGFRGDSAILPGDLRAAQIIAWIVLALSLLVINRLDKITSGKS